MSKRLKSLLLGALVVALGILGARYALQDDPILVRVASVDRSTVESTVSNTRVGTVRARHRASLAPEIGGKVVEIARRKGDRVQRAEVLVRLDDRALRAELVLAERGVDAAVAQHERACIASQRTGRELERHRELSGLDLVSKDALDRLQSLHDLAVGECKTTEAEAARMRATVEVARVALEKALLRAPFDGVVAELRLELGEWITPSPPMIQIPTVIDLIDTRSLYVSAPMDEVDSARTRVGQPAKVVLDPYPQKVHPGHVVRIAPYVQDIESQNRTVEIEVELEDTEFAAQLLPGTSADVEVVLEVRENVLRIPTSALLEGGRVLVLAEGLLSERRVEPGLRNWDFTEVRSGLEAGELVVVSLERAEVKAGVRAQRIESQAVPESAVSPP